MPTPITTEPANSAPYAGNSANVPADRSAVALKVLTDNSPGNAATWNYVFQFFTDLFQRVWEKAGFLDLASTWTAKQTFDVDGDGWQTLPLNATGGWGVSGGNTPQYRVDSFGRCWLRGEATRSSGTNTYVARLPEGARPPSSVGWRGVLESNGAAGMNAAYVFGVAAADPADSGNIVVPDSGATRVSLYGIAFYVDGK